MTFAELARDILHDLMQKSGVREWEDQDMRAAVTQSACEMAANIIYYGGLMANELYINEGTTLKINGEVDADYAWSMEAVANNAGRVSAVIDLGAAPRPFLYRWRCKLAWQATPTANQSLWLYKSESNGTYEDGDVGTADAAIVAAQKSNMDLFGQVLVDTADTSDQINGGVLECYERYLSIAGWNEGGSAINATDSNFYFSLTPIYDQMQS